MNLICNSILLLAVIVGIASCSPSAKVTISVINDDNNPIEGAEVYVFRDGPGGITTKGTSDKGLSDLNGKFISSSTNYNNYIAYGAKKKGYYDSHDNYQFRSVVSGRWQPWNPELKVLLKKIENPVPMYVRDSIRSKLEIPVVDKDIGFDLIAYDWIAPYGTGTHADFIFNLQRLPVVSRKNYDATLTVTFSNKGDGIQSVSENLQGGSRFKLPRYAPETGYESKLVLRQWFADGGPVNLNFNFKADDLNYVFRIRSVEKNGKIESAMYGKIRGNISFTAMQSNTAKIYFLYYLNPDGTRNLEFDPKHNLFGKLPDLERVTEP